VLGKQGPLPLATFNKVIQVNLIGTFNVIRLAAERMQAAGLDGIDRGLRRPEAAQPHAETAAALPTDLGQATEALRGSELVRALLGDPLHANLLALHGSSWDRFGKWSTDHAGDTGSGVTAWENDEYLMAY